MPERAISPRVWDILRIRILHRCTLLLMIVEHAKKILSTHSIIQSVCVQVFEDHWNALRQLADMSELEHDGVAFDAIASFMILSVLRMCEGRSKDFESILSDARVTFAEINEAKKVVNGFKN